MNILVYFSTPVNPQSGGTERVAHLLATHLREQGHKVTHLACEKRGIEYGEDVVYLPEPSELPTSRNVAFIKQFVADNKIDVIINEAGNGDSVFLLSHEHIPMNVNIITHIHFDVLGDLNSFYRSLNLSLTGLSASQTIKNGLKWIKAPYNKRNAIRWKKARFNYIADQTDKVVLLTPQHVRDFKNLIGRPEANNIVYVTNPVSVEAKNAVTEEKENLIVFVGRLSYSKRVDRILRVWQKVYKQNPDWRMAIIGSGDDEARLKALCRRMQLPRVEFVGHVEPDTYYAKAKILLMTSNYEGTPMVIYEAMAYGAVPVVMDTFCAVHTMIDHEQNGYITRRFDINDMSQNVDMLMRTPEMLRTSGDKARATIGSMDNRVLLSAWDELIRTN